MRAGEGKTHQLPSGFPSNVSVKERLVRQHSSHSACRIICQEFPVPKVFIRQEHFLIWNAEVFYKEFLQGKEQCKQTKHAPPNWCEKSLSVRKGSASADGSPREPQIKSSRADGPVRRAAKSGVRPLCKYRAHFDEYRNIRLPETPPKMPTLSSAKAETA